MKIYFDNLNPLEANQSHLISSMPNATANQIASGRVNTFWLVPNGTRFKKVLEEMSLPYTTLDNYSEPGTYFLEVNGDPHWWNGVIKQGNVPHYHVLSRISDLVIKFAKEKKLRIVIASDREGGWMKCADYDCFQATTDIMLELGLPPKSVLITNGNKKIKQQYTEWLATTGNPQLFEVDYSNHFGRIFFDNSLPTTPLIDQSILKDNVKAFNSLNRVHRTHRAAHLYTLAKAGMLDHGLVSANQFDPLDHIAAGLVGTDLDDYTRTMQMYYPRHVDGDWAVNNAANQYTRDIYTGSLLSFITETKYLEDVAFLTEKVFKPIALGHPMIVLASAGTLKGLEELGFKTNWCGINPSYNDIADDKERFDATHRVLFDWVNLPLPEKLKRIEQSRATIEHNFNLIRSRDFYKEAILNTLKNCEEYLND